MTGTTNGTATKKEKARRLPRTTRRSASSSTGETARNGDLGLHRRLFVGRGQEGATSSRPKEGTGYYHPVKRQLPNPFDVAKRIGLTLPDVEAATRYDGSPVLKIAGVFMAGLATHRSAEPNTLVLRADLEERESFIEDAPETYYLTEYYRRYPLVLVRLERVTQEALRELLSSSHRLTVPKTRLRQRRRRSSGGTSRMAHGSK